MILANYARDLLYDSHILGKATSAPTIIPTDSLESEEHLKDIYIL